jgi:ribonucleotide monophosphatase NagD (HAD superfamily)
VIGDRVRGEIKIGKQNGFLTVWLRKGKYKNELPDEKNEIPDYEINNLVDLLNLDI